MTLIYQLAEPIIAQYPPQYPKCKGGGSLTVENILGDADFYGEGVTVEGLTFSEIMRVTKIDLENGLETDVTDTCTLNEDKDGFAQRSLQRATFAGTSFIDPRQRHCRGVDIATTTAVCGGGRHRRQCTVEDSDRTVWRG